MTAKTSARWRSAEDGDVISPARTPRGIQLAAFFLPLLVFAGTLFVMQPAATGDEPHYLIYAHSILFDRDLDLRNNYEDGATLGRYYAHDTINLHAFDYSGDGRLYSVHFIGLPLLILPALLLPAPTMAVRLELVIIAALLAWQVLCLLDQLGWGSLSLRLLAWASVVFSLPIVSYASQIFPEIPGALLLVSALRLLLIDRPTRAQLLGAALAAAALPWLGPRFAPLSAGLGFLLCYRLLRRGSATQWSRQILSVRAGLLPLALMALSLAVMALFLQRVYGSPSPVDMFKPIPWSAAAYGTLYGRLVGPILSPDHGWLPFAPVHWFAIVGLIPLLRRSGGPARLVALMVGAYMLVIAREGPYGPGYAFPARHLVVLIPLAAAPLLFVISRSEVLRFWLFPLLGLSLLYTAVGVTHYQDLYPTGTGRTRVPVASAVQEIWPVIPRGPTAFTRLGDTLPHRIGRRGDGFVEAKRGEDEAGVLAYGPYSPLQAGEYVARFSLTASGPRADAEAAILDVYVNPDRTLAKRVLRLAELPADGTYGFVDVPFATLGDGLIETRVSWSGQTDLKLQSVEVAPSLLPEASWSEAPSWPAALLWGVLTLLVASLLRSAPWPVRSESDHPSLPGEHRVRRGAHVAIDRSDQAVTGALAPRER